MKGEKEKKSVVIYLRFFIPTYFTSIDIKDAVKSKRSDWHTFWPFALLCFYLSVRQEPCRLLHKPRRRILWSWVCQVSSLCWAIHTVLLARKSSSGSVGGTESKSQDGSTTAWLKPCLFFAAFHLHSSGCHLDFSAPPRISNRAQLVETTVLGSNCWHFRSTELSLWHDCPWSP